MALMWHRVQKLLKETGAYPRLRDKLLSFYNVLLISQKLKRVPLPGRYQPVNLFLRGHACPFAVRLGSTDWLVLVEIFLDGEYADACRSFPGSPPLTIVDLGANVGLSIRYWLEVFPEAQVVAVEPDTANFDMIRRNIANLNSSKPPIVVQACIVGQPQENVFLETASGREWAYAVTNSASLTTRSIRGITVEKLLTECAVNGAIDLLKCDIEGAEAEVFEQCAAWIQRVRRGVVEVHGRFTTDKLVGLLNEKGMHLAVHATVKHDLCLFDAIRPVK